MAAWHELLHFRGTARTFFGVQESLLSPAIQAPMVQISSFHMDAPVNCYDLLAMQSKLFLFSERVVPKMLAKALVGLFCCQIFIIIWAFHWPTIPKNLVSWLARHVRRAKFLFACMVFMLALFPFELNFIEVSQLLKRRSLCTYAHFQNTNEKAAEEVSSRTPVVNFISSLHNYCPIIAS